MEKKKEVRGKKDPFDGKYNMREVKTHFVNVNLNISGLGAIMVLEKKGGGKSLMDSFSGKNKQKQNRHGGHTILSEVT